MGDIIKAVRILCQTERERQEEYDKLRKDLFKGVCEQQVSVSVVLRLHDGTTYSPGYACPICGGEMVIEKIQMQERYMMRLCHRCGTTIKTPFMSIRAYTSF
jgi:predicted RNA-binding Zn-ribbon protein involved in translation (DUF1610 family)